MSPDDSVLDLWTRLRGGDPSAVQGLWSRFFPRMVALARRSLANRPVRDADPEDAAQSAFVSFWKRAEQGEFTEHLDRDQLWKLLSTITSRKVVRSLRREMSQKRGTGRTVGEGALGEDEPGLAERAMSQLPVAEFDLILTEMIEQLDEEQRPYVLLKLMGYTQMEIAGILECSERTVERKLQIVRELWRGR